MHNGFWMVLAFFVAAIIHEAGHATAWRLLAGARIRGVGLGLPGRFSMSFAIGQGFAISCSPLLLTAYVVIENGAGILQNLSRSKKIVVHGAGIAANMATLLGIFMLAPFIGRLPVELSLLGAASLVLALMNIFFVDGWRIARAALGRA